MQRLNFSIRINAPREKVWKTMLEDASYRAWTEDFSKGSYYTGDWGEGSKMLFLAPDKEGKLSGMVSRIKENRLHDHISIEHLGIVKDGKEDTTSDEINGWAGALENYTFKQVGDKTELHIDVDVVDSHKEMFQDLWPKALQKLKELAEKKVQ